MRSNVTTNTLKAGALRASADSVLGSALREGAAAYDRARDLPRLIRIPAQDCSRADGLDVTRTIIARLESALRAERNRARSGHWTYDLNRHIALRQAFLAESERLTVS